MRLIVLSLLVAAASALCGHANGSTPSHARSADGLPSVCRGLNEPIHWADFLGFFATEEAAINVAAAIDEDTFYVEARPAVVGDRWVVWAKYRQLPTAEAFEEHWLSMQVLGQKHGRRGLSPSCSTVPTRT